MTYAQNLFIIKQEISTIAEVIAIEYSVEIHVNYLRAMDGVNSLVFFKIK